MSRACLAPWRATGVLMLLALLAPCALAQKQVVIYRCTDASGAVSLQNDTPCPKGSKQVKRVLDTPPPAPPPSFVAAPAAAPVVAPATATPAMPSEPEPVAQPEAPRLPPPVLYECRTWDKERYLGEEAQPPPRCAPLQVTGLDGLGESAGGAACQMVEDQCQRVPDGALCDAWKQRLRETESQANFGATDRREQAGADLERSRRVLAESTCAP